MAAWYKSTTAQAANPMKYSWRSSNLRALLLESCLAVSALHECRESLEECVRRSRPEASQTGHMWPACGGRTTFCKQTRLSHDCSRVRAGESLEGMRSPRSPSSCHTWPVCGEAAELLDLFAAAWEESCVLWRRRAAAWAL